VTPRCIYTPALHDALPIFDALGIERAHVAGFSLGGGAALHFAERAPHRVASLTMLASIGVQELELLGSHTLNRALHGTQLAAVRSEEHTSELQSREKLVCR